MHPASKKVQTCCLCGHSPDLRKHYLVCCYTRRRSKLLHCLRGYKGFAASHVPLAKQELPVEVAGLYGVHVNLKAIAVVIKGSLD